MDNKQSTSLRKRQQINRANKMMFLWIAGISAVVGIAIVLAVFLVQKIIFGEKVIAAKNDTVSVLTQNLKNVDALRDNIRVLNTNEALGKVKLNDSDQAVQSVLDALPAVGNPTALASSLQTKLLTGVPGITIETINVDSTDDASAGTDAVPTVASMDASASQIGFSFSVSASSNGNDALHQLLQQIERSIRPFNVTNIDVEGQGGKVVMTVSGVSYYEPAQTIQLTQKVVKP